MDLRIQGLQRREIVRTQRVDHREGLSRAASGRGAPAHGHDDAELRINPGAAVAHR
jgi:hypothetical protein